MYWYSLRAKLGSDEALDSELLGVKNAVRENVWKLQAHQQIEKKFARKLHTKYLKLYKLTKRKLKFVKHMIFRISEKIRENNWKIDWIGSNLETSLDN